MRRRDFLQNIGLVSGSLALGNIPIRAFAHPMLPSFEQTEGKILVLLQLNGGNDGLNTVIPFEDSIYYQKRPNLGIAKGNAVALDDVTGLHPSLAPFRDLYENGKLSVVRGVGYENHNRSHFRSTDIWMSASDANQFIYDGWAGRYLHQMYPDFPAKATDYPMAVQLGSVESMVMQSPAGSMSVVFENPNTFYQLVNGSKVDSDPPPNSLAGEELKYLKQIAVQSIQYASVIKTAADKAQNAVTYPNTNLGRQLAIIADLIAGGLQTPVYMASIGGFDTHANQLTTHASLLKQVADAVAAFQSDLDKQGKAEKVVVMTFSEFGRRLNENGTAGTDHGTQAPLFVIGDPVKGGLLGNNPDLKNLDSRGDAFHQFDFRQIYTTILQDHLGMANENAQAVLGRDFEKLDIFEKPTVSVDEQVPFALTSVNPNPFSTATTVSYELARSMNIKLSMIDMTGRELSVIQEGRQLQGRHDKLCQLPNLRSGVYLMSLQAEGRRRSSRVVAL